MIKFNAARLATLRVAVDRVIPADDFPSGWEAGVGDYLLGQFTRDLAPLLTTYQQGLDQLDAIARTQASAPFVSLSPAIQDTLLQQVEAGVHGESLAHFFRLLIEHTMEGFYSDPSNSGNREAIAWQMIGFEVCG